MKKNILLLLITVSFLRINAQTNVVINVLDKTKGVTNLYFQDYSVIRTIGFVEIKDIEKTISTSDSTYTFVIETLSQPNIVFSCLHNEFESKQILITPGDTVLVVINFKENEKNRFEVIFYGRNEENYNAHFLLNKEFDRNSIMKMASSVASLEKYIQIIDSAYSSNTEIINATLKPSVLKDLMLNEEKAQVFRYLDFRKRVGPEEIIQSDFLSIKNRYFPDKIVCENPLFMKSVVYALGMDDLKNLLCEGIKAENQLMASTDTIVKYFNGELKDYLLVMNFYSSVNQYKKNKDLNGADVDNWFYDHSKKITDVIYKNFIQYSWEIYKILNNPFPENVLKEKIIKLSDSSVYTIGSFLKKYKGLQIVIDNWATWCAPCIREIREGKENVQKLKEIGNSFVYISLDVIRDFNKAKEKAAELGIIENAYIIPGDFKTEYAKHLNISEIPRYIMVDEDGNIKNLRMTYPSNISYFSEYGNKPKTINR